jgi:hypothetical protein
MKTFISILLMFFGSTLAASELPQPQGRVLLTISGNISVTNGDGVARFDRAMIEAIEQHSTSTKTPWYADRRTFSGPLFRAMLDAVGAQGQTVRAIALNDYSADVPISDLREHQVILATHLDGTQMSVREKGPFFLIYPFDEAPELFNEI